MNSSASAWQVKDKNRLFQTIMDALAGGAIVSFEGDLKGFRLQQIIGASTRETAALKRNTLWPEQDFVTVPLEPSTVKNVIWVIGGTVSRKIIHIQIEKAGVIAFAAYDNFSVGSVVFGEAVKPELFEALISQGSLKRCTSSSNR